MEKIKIACETKDSVLIDELTEFQGDLKSLSDLDRMKLRSEILNTGFAFPILVWKSGSKKYVLGGHQRLKTLKGLKEEGYSIPKVPVVYVEAKNKEEAKRRVLQDVNQYGIVNAEGLHNFIVDAKIDFGSLIDDFRIPDINFESFHEEYFPEVEHGEFVPVSEHTRYTKKIEIPIYEPKSKEPPPIEELVDKTKTDSLLKRIEKANVPDEVREFLKVSAWRHNVFHFERIAEYYSHAPKNVQELMEESALVLIDFNKAIENGYVHLSEQFAEAYKSDK